MKYKLYFFLLLLSWNCTLDSKQKKDVLPVLGEKEIIDGKEVPHTIPSFSFLNQDSVVVTNDTFADKVYVTDFFFTACPTICPKMTQQMKRLHDVFADNPAVALISHTIDTKRDSVPQLRQYAQNIGITSAEKWHFVTGEKEDIYEIADDYFSIAIEDGDAPEGFDHSGRLILVDKAGRVRAFADGTNPTDVDRLILDIEKLLQEYQESDG
ncbi:MAG: SCO family protein [Bacteroidota bacterium]